MKKTVYPTVRVLRRVGLHAVAPVILAAVLMR